uniref:Uncharacterized protein n=1 Tax=Arion vulgaris TaxID=1028688 RepID=A0A0B6ZXM9_9EUPU
MAENREPEVAYTNTMKGKKPKGRPRKRWKDNIEVGNIGYTRSEHLGRRLRAGDVCSN